MRIPTRGLVLNHTAGNGQLSREYAIYDVFTDTVADAEIRWRSCLTPTGLDDARMQAIAGEFNLSETVFLFPPENGNHSAQGADLHDRAGASLRRPPDGRQRPSRSPKAGTASVPSSLDLVQVLEEQIGAVRCAVRLRAGPAGLLRVRPAEAFHANTRWRVDRDEVAAALARGTARDRLREPCVPLWSAGVPFVLVPMHDIAAVERAKCDASLWEGLRRSPTGNWPLPMSIAAAAATTAAAFHARMFAPHEGIAEDPATGSAAAALSGAIHHFDGLLDGHHAQVIEQGVEMGRPSLIHLHIDCRDRQDRMGPHRRRGGPDRRGPAVRLRRVAPRTGSAQQRKKSGSRSGQAPPSGLYRRLASGGTSGRVAQLVEQLTLNQRVHGSSPCAPTIFSIS